MITQTNNNDEINECAMIQSAPVRLRTIPAAMAHIKENDPQTAFTVTALRRLLKSGEIPSIVVGNKRLINIDILYTYLNNSMVRVNVSAQKGLRKISEKIH